MFSFAPKLGFISLFSCMRRIRNTCNAAWVLCGHWISCCLRPSLFLWPLARICLSDSTPLSLCISSLSFPPSLILLCCRPNQHHCMRSTRIISQQRTSDLDFLCNTGPSKTTSHSCFSRLIFRPVLFSLACRLSLCHHFHREISCKQDGIHSLWRSLPT